MIDNVGSKLADGDLLDRVRNMGALVVRREPVESLDFIAWRSQLRAIAKSRGFRIHVRRTGDGAVIVSNPDHVVDQRQLRAAVSALTTENDSSLADRHTSL